MNSNATSTTGALTSHGLAGLIGLCLLIIVVFHFMGFRFVFTLGGGGI